MSRSPATSSTSACPPSSAARRSGWAGSATPDDVSLTPGNHDAYVRDAMPHLAAAFAPWTQGDAEYAHGETFPFVRVRGDVALIGLSTATPTGPLMATGRLGSAADRGIGRNPQQDRRKRARARHPHPSSAAGARRWAAAQPDRCARLRGDGRAPRRRGDPPRPYAQEHGRPSRLARHARRGRRIPIIGAPSASSASTDPRQRAAYHLIRLERAGEHWRISARARGLALGSGEIGERTAPAV